MSEFLPLEVREGLAEARKARRQARSRIRVRADGVEYPVLRHWNRGFALSVDDAPNLRGLVDLFDGARHLCQALIVASTEDEVERVFEFKYATRVTRTAPPADFARDADAPVALLPPAS